MTNKTYELRHEISNNVVCATSKGSDQPVLEYFFNVMLLAEHRLEFLSLEEGCTGSSESRLVKMSFVWKSHVAAQIFSASYKLQQMGTRLLFLEGGKS